MMEGFIKTTEWQEIKEMIKQEFEMKPLKIKTEGKTADRIALEVLANEMAIKNMKSFIRKVEGSFKENKNIKKYR